MVQCTLAGARTNHIVSTISYKPEGQRAPAPKHQPTEGGGRAVGLAGEIAPAERQNPSATERLAVLQHQLAEAADVAQARAEQLDLQALHRVRRRDQSDPCKELFGFLDHLDGKLGDGRPFLLGERPTLADVLTYVTLVRFDVVYNPLFRTSRRRVMDYPNLPNLLRRLHALPGVAETLRYDHMLRTTTTAIGPCLLAVGSFRNFPP